MMAYNWLDEYLLSKKGVVKDFKEEWGWERYMIEDKLFVALCYDEQVKDVVYITLKLEPEVGMTMRSQFPEIIPGYYMNKLHWNSIVPNGNVPDEILKSMVDQSYNLVLGSFSKKKQAQILGQ